MKNKIQVGDIVKVVSLTDETATKKLLNKTGMVIYLDGFEGVGNTKKDPLIGVEFENGKVDDFWTEELEKYN